VNELEIAQTRARARARFHLVLVIFIILIVVSRFSILTHYRRGGVALPNNVIFFFLQSISFLAQVHAWVFE